MSKFEINSLIKVVRPINGAPSELVGKFGFIEDSESYIAGVKNWIIIILDEDGTPLGNGPVPESSIELTEDPAAKKAFELFNNSIQKITDNIKEKSINIEKALEEISKKHGLPVTKIREIYTDVYDATKGLIYEKDQQSSPSPQTGEDEGKSA